MKKTLTAVTMVLALQPLAYAEFDVVYGKDNRKDVYEVSNALHRKLAKSTAGMIHLGKFSRTGDLQEVDLVSAPTLERGQNICASEAFSQQPLAPTCSGFLVGPDILITAGHCYKSFDTPENVCKSYAWVFDYDMESATHDPTKNISMNNVYLCKQVLHAQLDSSMDYAVVKLDRKVTGRSPLEFRTSGKISDSAPLVVIGHPSGLPTKISDGGRVTKNDEPTRFSTTLDTFHGNSGSAVFDARTGLVEGILIMGKEDYRLSDSRDVMSCKVVNKCDDNGRNCLSGRDHGPVIYGEVVLRIGVMKHALNKALELK